MVLSLLYGRTAGVTGGLIWGLLSLLNGAYVIHPIQFFLDCLFGPAGVTGGLIWGLLSLLNGAYVIHPIQFFLDCLFGPMA